MPKRKRHRTPDTTRPAAAAGNAPLAQQVDVPPVVDPAVAMFAERHRAQQEAERRAKEAEKVARREAERLGGLLRSKDEAAARLKAVRRQEVIAPGEVEKAEAAYTAAAADLVEAETGERPTWAPARPAPEPETEPDGVVESEPESTDEASSDEEPDPSGAETA